MRYLVAAALCLTVFAWSAPASAAVSRGEFIRKGDALCERVKRELAPLRARAEEARSFPEEQKWVAVADIWADQIRIQKRFVDRFHAIGTPANDRRARALHTAMDRGLVLARRVQRAFAERDTASLPNVLRAYLTFTVETNSRTRAYGFRICGH